MMAKRNVQRKMCRHIVLGSYVGAIGAGFASPVIAQECDPIETAKLIADDGIEGDYFGTSAAISGDSALVGSFLAFGNSAQSGAVHAFKNIDGVWTQVDKFVPESLTVGNHFGGSIAISGDTAIIGAMGADENGDFSGTAYIFTQTKGQWTQQAQLLANDGAQGDAFGSSVSIHGDTAIISAPGDADEGAYTGSAYIFTRTNGLWTQQAKLLSPFPAEGDGFGTSVSIEGNAAFVGTPGYDEIGSNSGVVYEFTRTGAIWSQTAKLLPDDGAAEDLFGSAIAIDGDTAVIGAWSDDDNGSRSGSVYIFERHEGLWTQQAKLLPVDGAAGDQFGGTVSMDADTVVVSAKRADIKYDGELFSNSGAAYVFTRTDGVWSQQNKLLPADGLENRGFGQSVVNYGETIIVGALGDNDNGFQAGAAYIFDLNCAPCLADLTNDGIVDFFDISVFLKAFNTQDPIADFTGDGEFNFLDVNAFLSAFAAGCP